MRERALAWRRLLAAGLASAALILVAQQARAGVLDASWTAPTTNTDGSPLTDLASYKVYYGAATGPCPGGAFFLVISPTTSPAPGTTVSFRLKGLTSSSLYFVSVTAVGIWLLVRSVRQDHSHLAHNAGFLAFATGLVPCPLTTFIMIYSVANGILIAGLLITAAMAIGMIATILIFVGCTIVLRERALQFFERTTFARERIGRTLEIVSALMIVAFGLWLFATRAT